MAECLNAIYMKLFEVLHAIQLEGDKEGFAWLDGNINVQREPCIIK